VATNELEKLVLKPERDEGGRFLPGHAKTGGRPPGKSGAHVLAEQLRKDLAEEWRKRGAAALADLSSADLVKYALASLPRELLLQVQREPSRLERAIEGASVEQIEMVSECFMLISKIGAPALEALRSMAAKTVSSVNGTDGSRDVSVDKSNT
jgi:hypothetical protein